MSANTHEHNCGCYDEVQHCTPGGCPYCSCLRLKAERGDTITLAIAAVESLWDDAASLIPPEPLSMTSIANAIRRIGVTR